VSKTITVNGIFNNPTMFYIKFGAVGAVVASRYGSSSSIERCCFVILSRTSKLELNVSFRFDIESNHQVRTSFFCFNIESERNFEVKIKK
jgi:hypothetical protein